MRTFSAFWSPYLTVSMALAATPTRQQEVHSRAIASASSCVTSFRLLNLMNSSRELMICGLLEIVKTVEPWEEKVWQLFDRDL